MWSCVLVSLATCVCVPAVIGWCGWFLMIRMPGNSYRGPLPPLTPHEMKLREALRRDVERLAGAIGERNVVHHAGLVSAANALEETLSAAGYEVRRQEVMAGEHRCHNLEVEIYGRDRARDVVVIGAHYDSALGSPGANDNGSGAAAVLSLARVFASTRPSRTLRFVEFVNEEAPHFQSPTMGSLAYAMRCRQRRERVVAMLSLETMGYYNDHPGSQRYPSVFDLFYPLIGNFIAIVGNVSSQRLVRTVVAAFRRSTQFPSEGVVAPSTIPGVGWSDQWAFWRAGYPAIMVTDTAPFRYPYYHTAQDTPGKLDYDRLARVVGGLQRVVEELAGLKL